MGVTVKDIARVAGVSTATVSRALRGFESVDPEIRRQVMDAASRLNYVASPAAAALSTGRAGSIGIITPYTDRLSFQRMLTGIERETRTTKTDVLIYCTGDPSDAHPVPPHKRLARRVDGFLVLSLSAQSPDLEQIFQLGMPVTMFGSHGPWTSSIRIDDRLGASNATEHLIGKGHRRIAVIYGREAEDPAVLEHQRHLGYRDAMGRAGLPIDDAIVVEGDFTVKGGVRAMDRLLDAVERPTAVFSFSDEMAYGAILALRRRGLEPGRDVAIIGYDGHEISEVLDLSTVSVPYERIGAEAARKLLDDIAHPGGERTASTLEVTLIERGSTRSPSQ